MKYVELFKIKTNENKKEPKKHIEEEMTVDIETIDLEQPCTPPDQQLPQEIGSTESNTYDYNIEESSQKNYQNWKKNSKHLYDYLNTNTSRWPSLSVQIFPDIQESQSQRRLLLSQFTSGQVPQDETIYLSSISTSIPLSSINNFEMDFMEFHLDSQASKMGKKKNLTRDIEIQFPVGEECNRTRYMYSNPDVIASASSKGHVYIHNKTKCLSNTVTTNYEFKLEPVGAGTNEVECSSVAWNFQNNGVLANCNNDGNIYTWDLNKIYSRNSNSSAEFENKFMVDTEGCNDVSWMVHHTSILAAACESQGLGILDTRTESIIKQSSRGISNALNSVQFHWENDTLLCTGSSAGIVSVWDMRDLSKPVQELTHSANSSLANVQWNPKLPNIVASAGLDDGLVKIWDTAKHSESQNQDGLIFTHGGHMLGCNDVAWDFHDEWLLASVSNDNSIHVWKPAQTLIKQFYV